METISIHSDLQQVSRICLGTWALGGWCWGGTEKNDAERTIHKALDMGINFIDTAPVYGFGKSEELVGEAIQNYGSREKILIATKTGLEWQDDGKVFRNTAPSHIEEELNASLKRLKTDYIDLYQIHWPDPNEDISVVAQTMDRIYKSGKVRAIGVSNFSVAQIEQFRNHCPVHTSQPPYNLFERDLEDNLINYCNENKIVTLAYGAICRGLLSGRMHRETTFDDGDIRRVDPKFQVPRYPQYLNAVEKLKKYANDNFQKTVLQLAVRWILDKGQTVAIWGARRPEQLDGLAEVSGWRLSKEDFANIDHMLAQAITDPIGPEFMSSPDRRSAEYKGRYPIDQT